MPLIHLLLLYEKAKAAVKFIYAGTPDALSTLYGVDVFSKRCSLNNKKGAGKRSTFHL